MIENAYTFQYCGKYDQSQEMAIPLNTSPDTINLYRAGPREILLDFPIFIGPLEIEKPCDVFLSEEEFEEMNKLFGKPILTNEDIGLCRGTQRLSKSVWEYGGMGLFLRSRLPVPYYECFKCGDKSRGYGYEKMITESIVFILGNAAIKHHYADPDIMFASIHV